MVVILLLFLFIIQKTESKTLKLAKIFSKSHIYPEELFVYNVKSADLEQMSIKEFSVSDTSFPNPKDRKTVSSLAEMTLNAYYEPENSHWTDIDGFNLSSKYGWDTNSIRGYVYESTTEDLLVITVKGTSTTWIGGGVTSPSDKLNDNLMFSCCCASDVLLKPSCSCSSDRLTCNQKCIVRETNMVDSYYNLATTLFVAIHSIYPANKIVVTGHSLGGALASLIGLTYKVPVFTFNSPGEVLFASRIGLLPSRPDHDQFISNLPIYHFGNDRDPIFKGSCTGISSFCYLFGYAMESTCHLGKQCIYKLSSTQLPRLVNQENDQFQVTSSDDIRYHSISKMIDIIKESDVPECIPQANCTDCSSWHFN